MKTICLVLTIICFSCHPGLVQNSHDHGDEEGVFAYATNKSGALSSYKLKESKYSYKFYTTKKVLDDLILAKGVKSMARPTLIMNNAERRVAWAKPSEAIIGLEEKAYDICASFGPDSLNALAALLSHELTHYYEKHDWKNRFIRDFGGNNNNGNAQAEKLDIETQADFLGGFLSFMAGYNTLGMMPRFLESVYHEYGFPDDITGYPSLDERKAMANKSLDKLRDLIDVFETANYLIAIKDYESAKTYYDHILVKEKYQSREIYNNMGVTAFMAALDYFSMGELKYFYPVELDVNSRLIGLRGSGTLGQSEREEIRKSLIDDAIEGFKTALTLDNEYMPALLNIGCAYALSDNFFDAEYHAQKALRMAEKQGNDKVIADAHVLLGIIEAKQQNTAQAQEWFGQAIDAKNSLGSLNLLVLQGEDLPSAALPGRSFSAPEKIDDISLDQMVNQLYQGSLNPQKQIEINKKTLLAINEYSSSNLLINFMPFDDAYSFFHYTTKDYSGKTNLGIGIGDKKEKLVGADAYGTPQRIIAVTDGEFLVYFSRNIIFKIDGQDRVKGWAIYRQKEKTGQ
jgi:tetratricopeptide (TPR) repeat protein